MSERGPILCAVTDRRRLGPADSRTCDPLDANALPHAERRARDVHPREIQHLLGAIAEAAAAGIDLVQIREPDLPAAVLLDLVTRALAIVRGARTRILVNDRLDVALAAGAHGVHLRSTSFDAPRARAIVAAIQRPTDAADELLIGRSVHSVEEAVEAEAHGGLDYLILGTMFPTQSKPPTHALAGPETLRTAVKACRLPVLAIGGITLENVGEIARAGAAGVAAIGLFSIAHAPQPLTAIVDRVRRAFAEAAAR